MTTNAFKAAAGGSRGQDETTRKSGKPDKAVEIVVDDELVTMPSRDTTPNDILAEAGLDPATHYLMLVRGRERISYQGRGGEEIKIHPKETFVSLSTGPTPTS